MTEEKMEALEFARHIATDDLSAMTASWLRVQQLAVAYITLSTKQEGEEGLSGRDSDEYRNAVLEEAAKVAERAVLAGERVRNAMAPEAPIAGLENALHGIVVTTAKGIAANIRALIPLPAPPVGGSAP